VALLRRELGIPVVGNGGVDGAQALRRCREQAGTGGVMIGRGAVCRPWIFARLRAAEVASAAAQSQGLHKLPDLPETEQGRETARSLDLQALGRRELELIASLLPEEFHLSRARRFFFYLCDNLRFGYRLKMHMQEAPELEDISRMWAHYFERNPDEREIIFG
jgi:tRNA-dihydrouridine synthase